jgi:hypothetical protein
MNASGEEVSRNIGRLSGYEPSLRRAAREVEESWEAAIKDSSLEQVPARNLYAQAKGR